MPPRVKDAVRALQTSLHCSSPSSISTCSEEETLRATGVVLDREVNESVRTRIRPDELVDLLRKHDGLTTSELAERTDAPMSTTWERCLVLQEEGRISGWEFGAGQRKEVMWYAVVREE